MANKGTYISKVKLKNFDPSNGLDRGVNKFTEITWYLIKMFFFLTAFPFPNKLKIFFLKLYGAKVGDRINIKPRVNIHMPWNLQIGNDVWIGEEVFILNFKQVLIGNNVCISQRAFLCGGNHDFRNPSMPFRNGAITIEDGAWVGASVFVGPGITIGSDSIITAASSVTSSVGTNGVYRGNPAIIIGNRWK